MRRESNSVQSSSRLYNMVAKLPYFVTSMLMLNGVVATTPQWPSLNTIIASSHGEHDRDLVTTANALKASIPLASWFKQDKTPCYVCGSAVSTISPLSGNNTIDLSSLGLAVPTGSCNDINEFALQGILTPDQCTALGNIPNIKETCGCSIIPPSCLFCGGNDPNATLLNPNTTVDIEFLGFPSITTALCSDVFDAAYGGLFSSSTCDLLFDATTVQTTCGCQFTDLTGGDQGVLPTPSDPIICNMCGDNTTATITNPNTTVDVSFLNFGSLTEVLCNDLYLTGIEGVFSNTTCDLIQSNTNVQTQCGCSVDDVPVPPSSPVAAPPVESPVTLGITAPPTTVPVPCNFCGVDNATISNGDAIIDISVADLGGIFNVTCEDIFNAGLAGAIPIDKCPIISEIENFQTICGCSNAPVLPTSSPTSQSAVCYLCGGDSPSNFSNPDGVIDTSLLGIPNVQGNITCEVLSQVGLTADLPTSTCDTIEASTVIKQTCGCPGAVVPTAPVVAPVVAPTVTTPTVPAGDPCYICNGNSTLNITNPGTFIDLSDVDYGNVTCSDIYLAGIEGFLPDNVCDAILDSDTIQAQCGCPGSVVPTAPVVAPVVAPTASPTPCYICDGNNATTNITDPGFFLDLSNINPQFANITCKDVFDAGVQGILPSDICDAVIDNDTIQAQCGCPGTVVPTAPIAPAVAPPATTPTAKPDPCYICDGDSTANITNPSVIVDLTPFPGTFGNISCIDLYNAGVTSILPSDICDAVQDSDSIQATCGCPGAVVPTAPVVAPVVAPTASFEQCFICDGNANAIIANPANTVSLSDINPSPSFSNISCADLNSAGVGSILPPDVCDAVQANDDIQATCGCPAAAVPTAPTAPVAAPIPPTSGLVQCFICGDPNATILNNDTIIDLTSIPFVNETVSNTTCFDLFQTGVDGLIPPNVCPLLADNVTQLACGCSNVVNTDACYVCGAPNTFFSLPDATVDIAFLNITGIGTALCSDIESAAFEGVLEDDVCTALQSNENVGETCGCSTLPPSVPTAPAAPTAPTVPVPVPDKVPTKPKAKPQSSVVTRPRPKPKPQSSVITRPRPKPKPQSSFRPPTRPKPNAFSGRPTQTPGTGPVPSALSSKSPS
jgi:hypothetical protein